MVVLIIYCILYLQQLPQYNIGEGDFHITLVNTVCQMRIITSNNSSNGSSMIVRLPGDNSSTSNMRMKNTTRKTVNYRLSDDSYTYIVTMSDVSDDYIIKLLALDKPTIWRVLFDVADNLITGGISIASLLSTVGRQYNQSLDQLDYLILLYGYVDYPIAR